MTEIYLGPLPIIYRCPFCGNYYYSSRYISRFIPSPEGIYTDGTINDGWNRRKGGGIWFTTCPKCNKTFNKKHLIDIEIDQEGQQRLMESENEKIYGHIDYNINEFNPEVWENIIKSGLCFPKGYSEEEKTMK